MVHLQEEVVDVAGPRVLEDEGAGAPRQRRAQLLEFRHKEERRHAEDERRASELKNEVSKLKGRTDELIKLCAEQETRLMIDSLTGVHSRYAYERRLEEEFQRWQRHSQPLSFSIWDIDLFKRINDSYGHEAGDRLLRGVADLFARNKRAEDFLARIGGEEFVLLLPMTALDAAKGVAEKLRAGRRDRGVSPSRRARARSRCRQGSRSFAPAIRRPRSTSAPTARSIKPSNRAAIAASSG